MVKRLPVWFNPPTLAPHWFIPSELSSTHEASNTLASCSSPDCVDHAAEMFAASHNPTRSCALPSAYYDHCHHLGKHAPRMQEDKLASRGEEKTLKSGKAAPRNEKKLRHGRDMSTVLEGLEDEDPTARVSACW